MLIALYRRPGLIGRLIRWQTRGRVDHAAIWTGGNVVEATRPRVRVRRADRSDLEAEVFEILGPLQEDVVCRFLRNQLDKKYDLSSVLRFLSRRQASRESAGVWFCSELVFAALAEGGVRLFKHTEPWEVSPQMLMRSPFLRQIPNPLSKAKTR